MDESTIAARRYYAERAGRYEQGSRRGLWRYLRGLETPAVLRLAQVTPGHRVLDAGCGTGHYAAALLERGAVVTGLDVSEAMLTQARERLGIATVQGDLLTVQLEPVYDRVVCAGVLEFVPRRAEAAANLARGLAPGGKLVVLILARCVPGYGFWALRRMNGINMPLLRRADVDALGASAGLVVEECVRAGYNWVARFGRA